MPWNGWFQHTDRSLESKHTVQPKLLFYSHHCLTLRAIILNWPNLLSQSLWNRPFQPHLSPFTATLWLDGLCARRLQHKCSSPAATPLLTLRHITVHWSHLLVLMSKAENFPYLSQSFLNVTCRQQSHLFVDEKYHVGIQLGLDILPYTQKS